MVDEQVTMHGDLLHVSRKGVPVRNSVVELRGRTMFFAELGDGPPLLLLHGGGPGSSGLPTYARNIHALARDFRLIVPDLPGYGRSGSGLDHDDLFGDLADAMRSLLDALDIAVADIVGMSLGGACALRLALDTPNRVGRLVLVAPGGIGTTRRLPPAGLRHLMAYYQGKGPSLAKLTNLIKNDLVFDGNAIPDDLILARFNASLDPETLQNPPLRTPGGRRALARLLRLDLTRDRRLRSLATPTLVMWGTHDRISHPSGAGTLGKTMPFCDVVMLGRTGHWLPWERSATFNSLARAYLMADTGRR